MNVDFDQQDQQPTPEPDNKTTQGTVQPPERVTSSGRVVKMPRKYEVYVMGPYISLPNGHNTNTIIIQEK